MDIFNQEDELGKIGEYQDAHYDFHSIVTKRNGYKRNMDATKGLRGKSDYLNLRLKVNNAENETGYTHSRLESVCGVDRMIPAPGNWDLPQV